MTALAALDPSQPAIQIRGLRTHYDGKPVLKGIDLDVFGNEILLNLLSIPSLGRPR